MTKVVVAFSYHLSAYHRDVEGVLVRSPDLDLDVTADSYRWATTLASTEAAARVNMPAFASPGIGRIQCGPFVWGLEARHAVSLN